MSPTFRVAADAVVLLHAGFVVFVLLGGLVVWRWRWVAWLHLPAAVWGVTIEYGGWVCPLTPLENHLRQRSGAAAYPGDFVQHYFLPLLYPEGLTRGTQVALGTFALAINVFVYWRVVRRTR
ncbi:MAG: DUF2784 domain-containing protein [Acidobacteria bacterium]|nr:DUF2784 domain-containing protein [Acidobacteriota bacterium]MBI3265067.1 DUF2784 domain-containing protein [Acidobacteriota bacterium]